jgi:hypothetical protein
MKSRKLSVVEGISQARDAERTIRTRDSCYFPTIEEVYVGFYQQKGLTPQEGQGQGWDSHGRGLYMCLLYS